MCCARIVAQPAINRPDGSRTSIKPPRPSRLEERWPCAHISIDKLRLSDNNRLISRTRARRTPGSPRTGPRSWGGPPSPTAPDPSSSKIGAQTPCSSASPRAAPPSPPKVTTRTPTPPPPSEQPAKTPPIRAIAAPSKATPSPPKVTSRTRPPPASLTPPAPLAPLRSEQKTNALTAFTARIPLIPLDILVFIFRTTTAVSSL
jgi:hypothetical protein